MNDKKPVNTKLATSYNNPVERLTDTAKLEGSYMAKLLVASKKGKQVTIFDVLRAKQLDKQIGGPKPRVGEMVVFQYGALTDKTLPYWDKFPLIFILSISENHFTGINLHYLPPILRIKLLSNIKELANNHNYDENTRLRLTYAVLNRSAKYKEFKPCFKQYSLKGLKSKFIKIHSSEWDIASILPVAVFKKATPQKVWTESVKEIRKHSRQLENDSPEGQV